MRAKKIQVLMLAVAAAMSLTACTPEALKTAMGDRKESTEEDGSSRKRPLEESDDTSSGEDGAESKPARSGVVFGSEFDEDELDLTYLYAETLMTESRQNPQTGKMESRKLQILIPQGDYNTVNRDYAYGEKLGVEVHVELDPYILPYDHEDYTLRENLDYILDDEYDEFYSTEYKDVQRSETKGDEEQVQATVSYLYYDRYDDDYIPYQVTYQLCDFGDDLLVLVETTICGEDTTGKTPLILDEINAFYGADIQWDAEAFEARKKQFKENNDSDVMQVSTGWIMFELPKGWEEDWYNNDDYTCEMYAPDGDMYRAGCYITVGREYQSYGSEIDIAALLSDADDMELFKKAIADAAELNEDDVTVSDYGLTVLGQAMEISYTVTESGLTFEEHRWWITDKDYIYEITAGQLDSVREDAIGLAKQILAEGRVKGSDA
ncbi:MAG: hypothetical protein NC079_04330 [Clostridium sp.]|nr:hypothetical protein [Acetatifactor muris]MCM1526720.1 hypothetical protein [Bacteroides sp.]MCM1562820.1 hypothetical protein [Clostridium sp.]